MPFWNSFPFLNHLPDGFLKSEIWSYHPLPTLPPHLCLNSAVGSTLLTWHAPSGLHPAHFMSAPLSYAPSSVLYPNPCFDHQAAPWAPSPWAGYIMDSLHTSGQIIYFSWKMFSCLHLSKPSGMFKTQLKSCLFRRVPIYQPDRMRHWPPLLFP